MKNRKQILEITNNILAHWNYNFKTVKLFNQIKGNSFLIPFQDGFDIPEGYIFYSHLKDENSNVVVENKGKLYLVK